MEMWTIYWLLTIPEIGRYVQGVGVIFLLVSILTVIVTIFIYVLWRFDNDEDAASAFKLIMPCALVSIFIAITFNFAAALIPTKENMMYIIGAYAVTNVDGVEKLPPNIVNAANKFMEDYIEEVE